MEKIKSAPSAMDAVPEAVQKKTGEIAESGETYLETILVGIYIDRTFLKVTSKPSKFFKDFQSSCHVVIAKFNID